METSYSTAYSVSHIQPLYTSISDSHLCGGKCAVFIFCRILQMLNFQDHREPDVFLFVSVNKVAERGLRMKDIEYVSDVGQEDQLLL